MAAESATIAVSVTALLLSGELLHPGLLAGPLGVLGLVLSATLTLRAALWLATLSQRRLSLIA